MRTSEASAFNGKGWIPKRERERLFSAYLATVWSLEMVKALEQLSTNETTWLKVLTSYWGLGKRPRSASGLRETIRTLSNRILKCLTLLSKTELRQELAELSNISLLTQEMAALEAVASELRNTDRKLDKVKWSILFDEVEFLNQWQQRCVYRYISYSTQYASCKIATLPYAHLMALKDQKTVLVEGQDYAEVPVVMIDDEEFERVAKGLWEARLEECGLKTLSLAEVWPDSRYETVIGSIAPDFLFDKDQAASANLDVIEDRLDSLLIESLQPNRKNAAIALRQKNKRDFSNQFLRKYRMPFRFRLAKQIEQKKNDIVVPLYWGWKQMLKACGNNPREFLKLAEQCWAQFWSSGVVRPLTVREQYDALNNWARRFTRQAPTLPRKGLALQEILERTSQRLNARLYNSKYLMNEHLSVEIQDCSQDQAEAIAIGIAYGLVVPKIKDENAKDPPYHYPVENVELRLGYPVAVDQKLPLRQGETLRIGSLRQTVLSFWED